MNHWLEYQNSEGFTHWVNLDQAQRIEERGDGMRIWWPGQTATVMPYATPDDVRRALGLSEKGATDASNQR